MTLLHEVLQETVRRLRKGRFERIQLAAAVIATIVAIVVSFYENRQKERLRESNLTYEKQLEVLSQVQSSIDNLRDFVTHQRRQLEEHQAVLQNLQTERSKLQPLVEADRQVIEALFRIQAERSQSRAWIERLVGFLIGVVSSLAASLIWSAVRLRRPKRAPPPTDLFSEGPGS